MQQNERQPKLNEERTERSKERLEQGEKLPEQSEERLEQGEERLEQSEKLPEQSEERLEQSQKLPEQSEERLELLRKQTEQLDYIIRLLEQQAKLPNAAEKTVTEADMVRNMEEIRRAKLQALEQNTVTQKQADIPQLQVGNVSHRVEEQSRQIEEQRIRAEEQRRRVEEQRIRAEEQRRRVEEQRVRAEEQRKRIEEQRRRDRLVSSKPHEERQYNHSVETKIGTVVIGTIGVILILAALTILAVNYMTKELQGILLFIGAVLITLISELFVRKKLPRFSLATTSLGVALFYLAILLNYFSLLQLPELAVILLAITATAVSVWLSYRNQSAVVRCIALVGGYLCMYPIERDMGIIQMLSVILVVSMIGLGHLFISLPKNTFLADLLTNGLNLIIFFRLADCMKLFQQENKMGVILFAIYGGIIILIACLLCKRQQSLDTRYGSRAASVIVVTITLLSVVIGLSLAGTVFGYLAPLFALFAVLMSEKKKGYWTSYIPGIWLNLFFFFGELIDRLEDTVTIPREVELIPMLLILMVLFIWLLAQKIRGRLIFAWKALITGISVLYFLFCTELLTGTVFILAYLLIFFIIRERKDAGFEREFMIFGRFLCLLFLLIFGYRWLDWIDERTQGLLFGEYGFIGSYILLINLLIILFLIVTTMVERYRFREDEIPKTIILLTAIVLHLLSPTFSILEFSFVFVTGCSLILFLWKPPFTREFHGKPLIFFLYCSYMYLCSQSVFDIQLSVVSTIGLMVIAFLAIIYGSRKNHRPVRIYGLGLSLIVCIKLIFFDLGDISLLVKIILFLTVGMISLAISFVYNRMEAKARHGVTKESEAENENIAAINRNGAAENENNTVEDRNGAAENENNTVEDRNGAAENESNTVEDRNGAENHK